MKAAVTLLTAVTIGTIAHSLAWYFHTLDEADEVWEPFLRD